MEEREKQAMASVFQPQPQLMYTGHRNSRTMVGGWGGGGDGEVRGVGVGEGGGGGGEGGGVREWWWWVRGV